MEPEGADTWNPIARQPEVYHRHALYEELCMAIREVADQLGSLRVLDVGCGNGRSTRVYLDFGLSPSQLAGVDLREHSIADAQRSHSGIDFRTYDGARLPFEAESFDWVSICTVMSSIPGEQARRHVGDEIQRVLAPGGRVFFWDRSHTHGFAEGGPLSARELFPGLEQVSERQVCVFGQLDRILRRGLAASLVGALVRPFLSAPTHQACVLRKRG
jgi:SAM-dependent methyltransferase